MTAFGKFNLALSAALVAVIAAILFTGCSEPEPEEDFTHAFQVSTEGTARPLELYIDKKWDSIIAPAVEAALRDSNSECNQCIGSGCGSPEDGELKLTVNRVGRDVFVTVWMKDLSAWWLDMDWAGCEWPNVPEELLPIPSIAAIGVDFWYEPFNAIDYAIDVNGPLKSEIPWTMHAWNWFSDNEYGVQGMTRIGAFVVPQPCTPLPGCPYLLDADRWYSFGTIGYRLADGFSGKLEFRYGDTVDDAYGIGELTDPVSIFVPSVGAVE